jgi:hypothetical protein
LVPKELLKISLVYAFLRISRALATIAARSFNLLVVEFFDDFTQLECRALEESAFTTLEGTAISRPMGFQG